MHIALLQLNTIVGDVFGNAKKISEGYKKAIDDGAELVVTQELALLGYPPKDLLERDDLLRQQNSVLRSLAEETGDVPLLIGVAETNPTQGKALYNSAVVLIYGEISDVKARKQLLPTYDVFDESRHFEPWAGGTTTTKIGDKRIAILICEDIWSGSEAGDTRPYEHDPTEDIPKDVDVLVVLNSSPYYWGKGEYRLSAVRKISKRLGVSVVYVNQVGGNDDLIFDGRSFSVNKKGDVVGSAKPFEEEVVVVDTSATTGASYPKDSHDIEQVRKALVLGIKDYFEKVGAFPGGAVLGLSGGIDSALVAVLAVEALGQERVKAVAMPSKFSSEGSVIDAEALAENLGIELLHIPIDEAYSAFGDMLRSPIGWEEPIEVTEENVQSRIRGLTLMAISNRERRLVLGTGNKSEFAMGYATLYGDMAAGLLVIADLSKTLVYALAEHINKDGEVIPNSTITKPPSAELRPNQVDTDSLPPYDALDPILHDYIEERMGPRALIEKGYEKKLVERITTSVDRMEFKRRQAAPGLRVTSKAFGSGRRLPIAARVRT